MGNKRIKLKLILTLILLVLLFKHVPILDSYAASTKSMTVTFPERMNIDASKIVTIPNLKSIESISVDTGNVNYSINGNQVTITVDNGSPTSSVWDSTKYSKSVTVYRTSSINSFGSTFNYSDVSGYSNPSLPRSGSSYVVGGSYIPAHTKTASDVRTGFDYGSSPTDIISTYKPPSSVAYSSGGYSGTLSRNSVSKGSWEVGWAGLWRRLVTANYSGSVTRPASDTRTWRQNYSGSVYKGGTNHYYGYNVNIEYIDNMEPTINVNTVSDNTILSEKAGNNQININGTIRDEDIGNLLTIKYSIFDSSNNPVVGHTNVAIQNGIVANGSNQSFNNYTISIDNTIPEGNLEIKIWGEDNLGAKSSEIIRKINIDKTNPSTPSIDLGTLNWTQNNVDVTITDGTDARSGVNRTEYKLEGATVQDWTPYISTFSIPNEGQTTISSKTIDNVGNESLIVSSVIRIDRTNPNIPSITNYSDWTNADVTVTITDNGDSLGEVEKIEYKLEGATIQDWIEYTAPFDISLDGITEIKARVIDKAGNISSESVSEVRIDRDIPEITADIENIDWTNTDVVVNLTYSDPSGIEVSEYEISTDIAPTGAWTSYIDELTIDTEGENYLHYRAVDMAGNETIGTFGPYRIDKTNPNAPSISNNKDWSSVDVTVVITDNGDSLGEVEKIEYKLEGATIQDWIEYTIPFDISLDGITEIRARAIDKAGNISPESLSEVQIDKGLPEVGADIENTDWTNTDVIVNLTYSDLSGIEVSEYEISTDIAPTGAWITYINELKIDTEGENYLHYRAVDMAGNETIGTFGPYRIDKTNPNAPSISNNKDWSSSDVTVTIMDNGDSLGEVEKIEYKLEGVTIQDWIEYAAPFDISLDGITEIKARTVDKAENISPESVSEVRIDKGPPEIEADIEQSNWVNEEITVNLNFYDSVGIVTSVYEISKDLNPSNGWNDYVQPLVIKSEGESYIHCKAIDTVGNETIKTFGPYKIDRIKPSLTLVGKPHVIIDISDKYIDPGCTAMDDVSGDLTGQIAVDGKLDTSTEGEYYIKYTVEDEAGNQASITRRITVINKVKEMIEKIAVERNESNVSIIIPDADNFKFVINVRDIDKDQIVLSNTSSGQDIVFIGEQGHTYEVNIKGYKNDKLMAEDTRIVIIPDTTSPEFEYAYVLDGILYVSGVDNYRLHQNPYKFMLSDTQKYNVESFNSSFSTKISAQSLGGIDTEFNSVNRINVNIPSAVRSYIKDSWENLTEASFNISSENEVLLGNVPGEVLKKIEENKKKQKIENSLERAIQESGIEKSNKDNEFIINLPVLEDGYIYHVLVKDITDNINILDTKTPGGSIKVKTKSKHKYEVIIRILDEKGDIVKSKIITYIDNSTPVSSPEDGGDNKPIVEQEQSSDDTTGITEEVDTDIIVDGGTITEDGYLETDENARAQVIDTKTGDKYEYEVSVSSEGSIEDVKVRLAYALREGEKISIKDITGLEDIETRVVTDNVSIKDDKLKVLSEGIAEVIFKVDGEELRVKFRIEGPVKSEDIAYSDIEGHWAKQTIKSLSGLGILKGYEDKTFRPNKKVTRAEFLAVYDRLNVLSSQDNIKIRKNINMKISDKEWYFYNVMNTLIDYSNFEIEYIFQGNTDMKIPIKRETAAYVLARSMNLESEKTPWFKDIESNKFKKDIITLANKNLMIGYQEDKFGPENKLTRAELATIIIRLINKGYIEPM